MTGDVIFFVYIPTSNHEYNIFKNQYGLKFEKQITPEASKKIDIRIKNSHSRPQILSLMNQNYLTDKSYWDLTKPVDKLFDFDDLTKSKFSPNRFVSMETVSN